MKTNILLLLLLGLFLVGHASAITWGKTSVMEERATGDLVASAVDALGRVHLVYSNNSLGRFLEYRVRRAAGRDFESLSDSAAGTPLFLNALESPVALAMDVTSDLTVQIAVVAGDGRVLVFERTADASTWGEATVVATNGLTEDLSKAGISLCSAGNGALRSGLVYTSDTGRAVFSEQISSGMWTSPQAISGGANTGLAAKLVNTPMGIAGNTNVRRVAVFYNDVEKNVRIVAFTLVSSIPGSAGLWISREPVVSREALTRPDIAYHRGKLAITSVISAGDEARVAYHSLTANPSGGVSWSNEVVAREDGLGDLEFFGVHAPLAFDSNGDPLVAYQKQIFALVVLTNVELRTRRRVDGLGWELSVVEDFASDENGFQREVDLTISQSGDPALVFQRKARMDNADSTVVFARPRPEPWVLDRPEPLKDLSQVYTPGLCTGKGGKIHMVVSGQTGGLLSPLEEALPRLVTISGEEETSVSIPASQNPTAATAATTTFDGVVHIVRLRLTDISREEGDLLYSRGNSEGPIESQGLVEEGINHAKTGALILKSDGADNLYCAFLRADGSNARIRFLASGASTWETLETLNGTRIAGFDFDVRADGGWAASWYEGEGIEFRSNVDPRSGEKSDTLFLPGYDLPLGSSPRVDTAIAFAGDGRPRMSYSTTAGILNYLNPQRSGGLLSLWIRQDAGLGFNNAILEMESRSNLMHIMAHTSEDGGTLRHVRIKNDLEDEAQAFSVPAAGLTTSANRQSLAATLDENGFPVMAVGMTRIFSLLSFSNQVVLCRPADGMDRDEDGIPFLLEEAHCLNDRFPNSRDQLAQPRTDINELGVQLSFEFRRPMGLASNQPSGRSYGDFLYLFETSTDLVNWNDESERTGVLSLLDSDQETDEGPNCRRSSQGFLYLDAAREEDPKLFNRLIISRVR